MKNNLKSKKKVSMKAEVFFSFGNWTCPILTFPNICNLVICYYSDINTERVVPTEKKQSPCSVLEWNE